MQLHQRHPSFQGVPTLQRCIDKYRAGYVDDTWAVNDKKRKNCVSELLRFICIKEFIKVDYSKEDPNGKTTTEIYDIAYQMLICGDIDGCTTWLQRAGKFKMATYVAQCVANDSAQAHMREFLKDQKRYQKFNPSALKIVKLIACKIEQADLEKLHWMQALQLNYHFQIISTATSHQELLVDFC